MIQRVIQGRLDAGCEEGLLSAFRDRCVHNLHLGFLTGQEDWWARAAADAEWLNETGPKLESRQFLRGVARTQAGSLEDGISELEAAALAPVPAPQGAGVSEGDPEVLGWRALARARLALKNGEVEQCLGLCTEGLGVVRDAPLQGFAIHPPVFSLESALYSVRGEARRRLGQSQEADTDAAEAASRAPRPGVQSGYQAELLTGMGVGFYPEAQQAVEDAIELEPGVLRLQVMVRLIGADMAWATGRLDDVLVHASEGLRLLRDSPDPGMRFYGPNTTSFYQWMLWDKVLACRGLDLPEAALEDAEEGAQHEPWSSRAHWLHGLVLFHLARFPDAKTCFLRSLGADVKEAGAMLYLNLSHAMLSADAGELQEAVLYSSVAVNVFQEPRPGACFLEAEDLGLCHRIRSYVLHLLGEQGKAREAAAAGEEVTAGKEPFQLLSRGETVASEALRTALFPGARSQEVSN